MLSFIHSYSDFDLGSFWFEGNSLLKIQNIYVINPDNNSLCSAALYFSKMIQLAKNNDSLVESFLQVNRQAQVVTKKETSKCFYRYKLFNSGELIVATCACDDYNLKFRGQLNEFITKFGGFDISAYAELLIATHKNQA